MRAEAWRWFIRGAGLALGAALAVGAIYILLESAGVLVLVFVALLLAAGLEPLIDRVRTRSPLGRGLTLLLVYAIFMIGVVGLLLLVVPSAVTQFNDFGTQLIPLLENGREWARTIEPRALSTSIIGLIDTVEGLVVPANTEAPEPDALIALGITFAEAVISIISILALVYFWLTERARMQRFVLNLMPSERRAGAREAWNEIEVRLGAWIRGQLIIMGSVGLFTSVAYFLIGLEGALLLGVIAAIAEAIPLIGPALGAIPALLVAAMTGNVETVLIVAVVYFVIQVIEGNVLIPLVMRNTVGVPPFLVIVSILAGGAVAGIPGALISVPLVAALLVVVERLQARESPVPLSPDKAAPDTVASAVVEEAEGTR